MVLSRINDKINYTEQKSIDKEDKGFNATQYRIEVKDIIITIALGDTKYKYIDDGVLFSPIYLIINNKVNLQIGVYEFNSESLMDVLDEDGDLDIDKIDSPLLYKFTTYELLKEKLGTNVITKDEEDEDSDDLIDTDEEEEEDDEEEEKKPEEKKPEEKKAEEKKPEEDDEPEGKVVTDDEEEVERQLTGNFEEGIEGNTFNLGEDNDEEKLNLETRTTDDIEKRRFKNPTNWVQEFMKRNEYGIVDSLYEEIGTKKAGDCLFSVIQDALDSIGKKISVSKMRDRLSKDFTKEMYENWKGFYDMFVTELEAQNEQLENLKKIHDGMRVRAAQVKTSDRTEYKKIVQQAKDIATNFSKIKKQRETTEGYLNEFKYMKQVKSFEEMKQFIKTCDFWAETWALSTLETIFNLKLIVLSSENYQKKDFDNILLCGQINSDDEIRNDAFKPKYYIIVDHTGQHYKLITWKDKKILRFDEIPYGIRELIVNKCMEKNSGKFSFIPKFKALSKTIGDDGGDEDDDKSLYSSKTVLQFYSKSKDDFPGKGSGEKLDETKKDEFIPLSKIPNWRKKLSNFSVSPFILNGHKWNGVEWYYHASKFKNNNPQFSLLFSLDSKSDISTDPVKAKAAGGRTGIYTKRGADGNKEKVVLREPTIKVDGDFFGKDGRGKDEMEAAWKAKFTQNFEAQNVLVKTMDAKLQHFSRGKKPEVWVGLMRLRKELQKQ